MYEVYNTKVPTWEVGGWEERKKKSDQEMLGEQSECITAYTKCRSNFCMALNKSWKLCGYVTKVPRMEIQLKHHITEGNLKCF